MTGCYDVHGLTVDTNVDLQIPPAFRSAITMPAVVTVKRSPGFAFPNETAKRSGVFRYSTGTVHRHGGRDDALWIEYKTPVGAPRLMLADLTGHPEIRYTPAFERHGDIVSLARSIYRLKLLDAGWPLVHAAAITRDGSGTLITAPPDHGKTSTVLSLLNRDTRLLGDDHVLLGADGQLKSYPRPVHLSPFTLTGPLARSQDSWSRAKRRLAQSRFELLGSWLGLDMGERVSVPDRHLATTAECDRVFVLRGGDKGVTPISPDAAERHLLTATLDEFEPFGHYALRLYAHAFDLPLANAVGDLQRHIGEALAGVDCWAVSATAVAEYPRLIGETVEGNNIRTYKTH